MSFCPQCGKKAANLYADFCSSCGSSMKDLGIPIVTQSNTQRGVATVVTPPEPQMHAFAVNAKPMSRTERLMKERRERLSNGPIEQTSGLEPGEVNVEVAQDFNSILSGIELESDGLDYDSSVNSEKISFNLAPEKPASKSRKTKTK